MVVLQSVIVLLDEGVGTILLVQVLLYFSRAFYSDQHSEVGATG
jgi:hypothetical protein